MTCPTAGRTGPHRAGPPLGATGGGHGTGGPAATAADWIRWHRLDLRLRHVWRREVGAAARRRRRGVLAADERLVAAISDLAGERIAAVRVAPAHRQPVQAADGRRPGRPPLPEAVVAELVWADGFTLRLASCHPDAVERLAGDLRGDLRGDDLLTGGLLGVDLRGDPRGGDRRGGDLPGGELRLRAARRSGPLLVLDLDAGATRRTLLAGAAHLVVDHGGAGRPIPVPVT